ncbi:hypothetical protein OIDMADRAFT_61366 [Oidiodendron maius Zn]|uniref:Uncharacterized protein n=1 Tax=Oidiodendron maius (strain Zn) TaxID=913774 RepID=A0A0C3GQW9_OIDMZ|nr:hypothetical protein OIDMADRAFT_61366 [Oidiodendron maius Zn]
MALAPRSSVPDFALALVLSMALVLRSSVPIRFHSFRSEALIQFSSGLAELLKELLVPWVVICLEAGTVEEE